MVSTRLRVLALSALCIGSAQAGDSLIVEKSVNATFSSGGILGPFQKQDRRFKTTSLSVRSMGGAITIKSITLNHGSCSFESVTFPIALQPGHDLKLVPKCDVTLFEAVTDKGAYKIGLDKVPDQ